MRMSQVYECTYVRIHIVVLEHRQHFIVIPTYMCIYAVLLM